MNSQTPAEGIMKTGEFGDSKHYKVACSCGSPDHDVDFCVEAEDTGINVTTYVTAKSDYWTDVVKQRYDIDSPWLQEFDWFWKGMVNGFVRRVRMTWSIWTRGYVKTETTIAMTEQQALNYAETLKSAIKDVKSFKSTIIKSQETTSALKEANEQDCV